MPIETIEAYTYRGKVFTDRQKAVDHAEGLIEALIRPKLIDLGPRDRIRVMEAILSSREELLDLLNY